jgi:outer membrane protein, heavy metal efflux system
MWLRIVAVSAIGFTLSACLSLPPERGFAQTRELVANKRAVPADWSPLPPAAQPEIPRAPLSLDDAVRLALFHGPALREHYARLGFARADLEQARRLANPGFSYSRMTPPGSNVREITKSVSLEFTDLLMLPARTRMAKAELTRVQHAVAAEVLAYTNEVEVAWFNAVSAEQIAQMRELAARANEASAQLAQRFFDAGNIHRLQLEQEHAAATQARIDAIRARADAMRSRHALAGLIGLPTSATWQVQAMLAAPRAVEFRASELVQDALRNRLDLAAARQAVAMQEDALGVTQRWSWLGHVEFEYERERERKSGGGEDELLRGPTLSVQLPIFDQGQGATALARAQLRKARAELNTLALSVQNDAQLGIEDLKVKFDIAERYRSELLPRREAAVARMQERVNFMLVGVFELIQTKQAQYDAYQAYLEAVRDYWIARAELRTGLGGALPDDKVTNKSSIGVDAMIPEAIDHSMHGDMDHSKHGDMDHSAKPDTDKKSEPEDEDQSHHDGGHL